MGGRVVVVVLEMGRRVVVVGTGNEQQQSGSNTGNGQESSNAGNTTSTGGPTANNTTSTGGPTANNTTSTGGPTANNTTSTGGSTANNTTSPSGPYNATLTGVPENMKNSNNETAADFANNILAVHNRERADVKVLALVWSNSSRPTPRLGPTRWRLHATFTTTPSIWGSSARVRT